MATFRAIRIDKTDSGQTAKLVNNLVFTALVSVAIDTFAFGDALHMDRDALAEVLAHGSGGSRAAAILAASHFDLSGMRGAVGNLEKDVRIVRDLARERGAAEQERIVALAHHTLETLVDGP